MVVRRDHLDAGLIKQVGESEAFQYLTGGWESGLRGHKDHRPAEEAPRESEQNSLIVMIAVPGRPEKEIAA